MTDAAVVAAFIKANDHSPVAEGWANQPDPRKPGGGGTYRFSDGRSFCLTLAQCRLLLDGYPKWKVHDLSEATAIRALPTTEVGK